MRLSKLIQISEEIINLDRIQSIQYENKGDFYLVTFQVETFNNYSLLIMSNLNVIQVAYRFALFFKENDLTELLLL